MHTLQHSLQQLQPSPKTKSKTHHTKKKSPLKQDSNILESTRESNNLVLESTHPTESAAKESLTNSKVLCDTSKPDRFEPPQTIESMTPANYIAHFCKKDEQLLARLDLEEFIYRFASLLARPKSFYLQGNHHLYKAILDELDSLSLPIIPKVPNLNKALFVLQKFGTLNLQEIFAFSKILGYFATLLRAPQIERAPNFYTLVHKIILPQDIEEKLCVFETDGKLKTGKFAQIDNLNTALAQTNEAITTELYRLLANEDLAPYLVDRQVHFVFDTQTLLLKAGYTHNVAGSVLMRSQNGFFYVVPQSIEKLYKRQKDLKDALEVELAKVCEALSEVLRKHLAFFRFLNAEFDRFDLLMARLEFAKLANLEFLLPFKPQFGAERDSIVLCDFCHPILNTPKPTNIEFSQKLLVLTGVNAGGKTMLLKSIMSAAFLAKHLLPFKCNPHKSKIPYYKHIYAILSDPQNTKNDISTFAGRIFELSQHLNNDELLLGIDEIELGTDADEAASLYKTLLENLLQKHNKIIITTHHKRLAALMANDERVQMSAALFDIQKARPTFEFLHGSIGKSYAFETAERYGIPKHLIAIAKEHYGHDKERLNELIERSSKLELELAHKNKELAHKIQKAESKYQEYHQRIQTLQEEYQKHQSMLDSTYQAALNALKKEAKNLSDVHRNMGEAQKIIKLTPKKKPATTNKKTPQKGDRVSYRGMLGVLYAINKEYCIIALDSGMRIKADPYQIQLNTTKSSPKPTKNPITLTYTPKASVKLDLHGKHVQDAIEELQNFISDSLIAGFDEVLVYHGIGTGKLARAVREVLCAHPNVIDFEDAPPNMGGMGAKIIRL